MASARSPWSPDRLTRQRQGQEPRSPVRQLSQATAQLIAAIVFARKGVKERVYGRRNLGLVRQGAFLHGARGVHEVQVLATQMPGPGPFPSPQILQHPSRPQRPPPRGSAPLPAC